MLLNIKNFVKLGNITHESHHAFWLNNNFDFPKELVLNNEHIIEQTLKNKIEHSTELENLQREFLNMGITSMEINNNNENNVEDIEMDNDEDLDNEDNVYEIEKIIDHNGEGKRI